VSGTLDRTRFGPPVPVHLTEFMQGRGRPGQSGPLDGEGRRSLYLAVRRNFLVPFFLAFDFPLPSSTVGRRSTSNVPAQALALLNDPFVAQEAERWAERELAAGGGEGALVERMFVRALARPPTEAERADMLAFLVAQRAAYAEVPAEPAATVAADGGAPGGAELGAGPAAADPRAEADRQAVADLAHVLFNLKEFRFLR
jgi:hypothetical protein